MDLGSAHEAYPEHMANRPARSLKHEYELFVEEEIENYKESIPRSALLSIGDEAVAVLSEQPQLALTELLLAEEVDRLIFRRLRLPSYQSWRRRRVNLLREMRRPEHWGLQASDVVVRSVRPTGEARVLVAGSAEGPALYLAANGCEVTALTAEDDVLDRVLAAAAAAGLGERHVGGAQRSEQRTAGAHHSTSPGRDSRRRHTSGGGTRQAAHGPHAPGAGESISRLGGLPRAGWE